MAAKEFTCNGCEFSSDYIDELVHHVERLHGLRQIEDLKAENRRLREALKFYAEERNWMPPQDVIAEVLDEPRSGNSKVFCDNGKVAREALNPTNGGAGK